MPVDTLVRENTETVYTGEIAEMTAQDGDVKIRWSTDNPAEVAAAEAAFRRLRKTHAMVAKRDGKEEVITKFDPKAGKVVARPPIVGG